MGRGKVMLALDFGSMLACFDPIAFGLWFFLRFPCAVVKIVCCEFLRIVLLERGDSQKA
jgi:hypothetical protein